MLDKGDTLCQEYDHYDLSPSFQDCTTSSIIICIFTEERMNMNEEKVPGMLMLHYKKLKYLHRHLIIRTCHPGSLKFLNFHQILHIVSPFQSG